MARTTGRTTRRVLGGVALLALLVAMVLSTKAVTPEQLAAAGPERFDPQAAAQEIFERANQELPDQTAPLAKVLEGVRGDIGATAEELGAVQASATTYHFAVEGEATVVSGGPRGIEVEVDGVPAQTTVTIPLGPAINGTVLRDMMGFEFGDAPNQSGYQAVGDAIKKLVQEQVDAGPGDGAPKRGQQVRFVGVVSVNDTGTPQSPAKPVSVQPLRLEAGA